MQAKENKVKNCGGIIEMISASVKLSVIYAVSNISVMAATDNLPLGSSMPAYIEFIFMLFYLLLGGILFSCAIGIPAFLMLRRLSMVGWCSVIPLSAAIGTTPLLAVFIIESMPEMPDNGHLNMLYQQLYSFFIAGIFSGVVFMCFWRSNKCT